MSEGIYSGVYKRYKEKSRSENSELGVSDVKTANSNTNLLSIEMKQKVSFSKEGWDIVTAGKRKTLAKDRTRRGLGSPDNGLGKRGRGDGDFLMGAGALAESTLAPGML